jgi:hypothetical protein
MFLNSNTGLLGQGNENMAANTGQRGKRAVAGQLGQDSWDRKAWAGQDSWRMSGWYRQDKKGRTGWPEHDRRTGQLAQDNLRRDNGGRTAMTVKLGHDIRDMISAMTLDRITQIGQSEQALTGQHGQVRQDRMPGHDNKD